ncbi:nuclear transport factor 2 family protein [Aurantimonas aggregata]|uniref:Nuclear transport factor 2 family protein n=1 Tax=Aurantimonas aggregata TaxID=2047720 RepID=A0A6L9MGB5_9HYPH|nr:nuclear transport factor 2 family protein [Aurantimonas aggregata]NDV86833.1 nuclear transport factor 2 family protein [Aurantimonas aggregata]
MTILPKPIEAYFASAPDADFDALAAIFTEDAVVHDEGKQHEGIAAIRAWRLDTMQRTPFTSRPLSVETRNDEMIVPAEVTGAFPGSPVTLDHAFTLRDGRIALLAIK